ncbi:bromodomain-containing protein DDB_G0270170-like isoform X2 [Uloborus diversus]|uniref:bromodomain-containing protein DDB_G0270170-like isoform X2 n=1 Tax=Uloborus diversus TaxID=327109 RepID=UPI002409073E|nr:bromodomain-containing protein DDB_G0270170-like isoform X2 [Uloborus diversus]
MRLKHEIRQVEAPHSLILSNNSTQDFGELLLKTNDRVSPETLSHRLQKGWQHLQENSDPVLNNNNNNSPVDLNDNNNLDDDIVTSSADKDLFVDGDYRAMSSDDSDSSSEDESSASYSDTSPLLDVSSLGNSDVSLDSDMSEDSSSSSSSSSEGSMLEDCNNINNNNGDDEEEDMPSMEVPSMQSSWMSFSSASSSPAGPSRGQVVLPDVLPVGKVSGNDDDEPMMCDNGPSAPLVATQNLEITFQKRRSVQESGASRVAGDSCLVEITTQPDIQVDIRVNPVSSRLYRESKPISIKHGNTYPRETKNNKRYLRNRDASSWIVNDSFEDNNDESASKYYTLGDGIRLNNFTIVNGHKTLSLTELVKPNSNEENEYISQFDTENRTSQENARLTKLNNSTHLKNTYQNFERNYSKLPANVHMCCKDNWRFQKDAGSTSLKSKSSATEKDEVKKCNSIFSKTDVETYAPRTNSQKPRNIHKDISIEKPRQSINSRVSSVDGNSNKLMHPTENLPPKNKEISRKDIPNYSSKSKTSDSKLSSPELFEVYTMETALPHVSWSSYSKSGRESEWIKKRRNDREEIRRKLAMDSDTEDYISEKLNQHRENGSNFDRLKGSGNLQICFMNEAAKDQDLVNPAEEELTKKDASKALPPRAQKLSLPLSSATICEKPSTMKAQNNNNRPVFVTKRQRPKFFFNRPRSWHAAKAEENPFPEEDLLARHVRLQAEAREALAQAKDMARMQMEIERQKKKKSPIADIVGLPFPDGKNLLSYNALLAMNVAQLQVIVNDLHSQIETLNEDLVKFLLERDDLHMEQDSMLVDIEDLTRYLGLKGSAGVSSSGSQISVSSNSSDRIQKLSQ